MLSLRHKPKFLTCLREKNKYNCLIERIFTAIRNVKKKDMSQKYASEEDLNIFQKEWKSMFSGSLYLKKLRSLALKGSLRNSHFRSTCWKIFLECLPKDRTTWIDVTKSHRQEYEQILDKFHTDPRTVEPISKNLAIHNPLSQSHQSPWNQYFQDSELKSMIKQDVVRTFPEIEFFHTPNIQKMMISILFSYARQFPHVSYKQGMHELLAPIIFVLHYDQQAYLQATELGNLDIEIHVLQNQNYIEHDAFFMFCRIMETVEYWYSTDENWDSQCSPCTDGNFLGRKLKTIFEVLLKQHDPQLFSFLEEMEIAPQIFGIRWLRLLFGREFSIHDLLIVWDAIFANDRAFVLADYIFVAMLISIRNPLLQDDYSTCLKHLMHFPTVVDVQYIIDLALHLMDPDKNKKPDMNSSKILNPLHMKELPSVKNFTGRGLSSHVSSSNSEKLLVTTKKQMEARPKSLSIGNVNLFRNSTNDSKISDSRSKSSSLNEESSVTSSPSKTETINSSCPSESQSPTNKTEYFTLPRTRIKNVMESNYHKFRAVDLGQSIDGLKTSPLRNQYREMVSLAPSASSHFQGKTVSPSKVFSEKQKLETETSALKLMISYCTDQITQHVEKLQSSLVQQHLQFEDEMFIALAGLKRVRDILKGTVNFSEVLENDINPYYAVSPTDPSIPSTSDCNYLESG